MGNLTDHIRAEITAAATDMDTLANQKGLKLGEASVYWAAQHLWAGFVEATDGVDDDTYNELLDRFFGEILGILAGHATSAHQLIGDPFANIQVGAAVDGARMVLATLADLYAAHERSLPATAFARVDTAAKRRRAALDQIAEGDLAAWRNSQRPT